MSAHLYAHRVLALAAMCDALPRSPRLGENVSVLLDGPEPMGRETFTRAANALADDGILGLVASSTSAYGLLQGAPRERGSAGAFGLATAWAASMADEPVAPPVSPTRLRELARLAEEAGFVLVEPEIALPHVQIPRTALDRAIYTLVTRGALARPLLFVRRRSAPKGGLAKVREARVLEGWLALPRRADAPKETGDVHSIEEAARAVLEGNAEPMRGKALLREARARLADARGARGERSSASTTDSSDLARAVLAEWYEGAIRLYAVDPATTLEP